MRAQIEEMKLTVVVVVVKAENRVNVVIVCKNEANLNVSHFFKSPHVF